MDYGEFSRAGRDEGHLENYFTQDMKTNWIYAIRNEGLNKIDIKNWFWKAFDSQKKGKHISRTVCFSLYLIGFILFSITAIQSIYWVLKYLIS